MKGQTLQTVKKFTNFGGTLTSEAQLDVEIQNRVAKVSSSFGRLRNTVWDMKGLNLSTQLKVYRAVVLTSLLYACVTLTTYARHEKTLNWFHINSLKTILHFRWEDKVPDTRVLERSGLTYIQTLLRKNKICWAGEHDTRMGDTKETTSLLSTEWRKKIRQKTEKEMQRFPERKPKGPKYWPIDLGASDRTIWRRLNSQGSKTYEKTIIDEAKKKNAQRKSRDTIAAPSDCPFNCTTCNRVFRARICLINHSRTHSATN